MNWTVYTVKLCAIALVTECGIFYIVSKLI